MTTAESERITKVAMLLFTLPFFAMLQIAAIALSAKGRPIIMTVNSFIGLIAGIVLFEITNNLGRHDISALGYFTFNLVATLLCAGAIFEWKIPNYLHSAQYSL